jgi:hypothetical protein
MFRIVRQTAITICSGLPHPTRSLSRTVSRGQEGPKGILKPEIQPNTVLDLGIFKKPNVTTRNRKEVVKKSKYYSRALL